MLFLIYKFLSKVYERNFGLFLALSQVDRTYHDYSMLLISEGVQSTYNNVMVYSIEIIEKLYNYFK